MKQHQQAIKSFKQAIVSNPNCDRSYYNLAEALLRAGKIDDAIISFSQAIAINRVNPQYYYNLGEAFIKQNSFKQALVCFRQALKLNPQDCQLQFQLGKSFRNQGLNKEAITCFCRTIKLDPHYIPAYISLSYIKLEPEWLERLVSFYRQILIEHPNIPEALANLAEILAEQDNLTEAIAFSRQAIYTKTIRDNPHLAEINWQPKKIKAPDFIIIGAGKCGTTSLYKYLDRHPQIFLPNKKELRFFDKNFNYGWEWYLSQFPSICDRPDLFTGEASPSYLFLPHVAQRIKDFAPQTKLIVMLRNPVDRSISNYYQNKKAGQQYKTLAATIQQEILRLDRKTEQQLSYGSGLLSQSLYFYKLKRWMKIFPKDRFLILISEKFFANPATSLQQVFKFLDLPNIPIPHDNYQKYNTGSYPQASDAIRTQLKDFFSVHNQRLENYLQMNFNW